MLKQRLITAFIIGPALLLFARFAPEGIAGVVLAAILGVAAWEWANLARWKDSERVVYATVIVISSYAFATLAHYFEIAYQVLYVLNLLCWLAATAMIVRYPRDVPPMEPYRWRISMVGFAVLVPMGVAIWHLLEAKDGNVSANGIWLIFAAAIPVAADAGAYFFGRAFGKTKLAPRVSPNKTWGGFWGGIACAALTAAIGAFLMPGAREHLVLFVLLGIGGAMISVVGDLTVSLFKRHAGVKDTGSILPGHGGIMDRIDSVAAALPFLAGGFMLLGLI